MTIAGRTGFGDDGAEGCVCCMFFESAGLDLVYLSEEEDDEKKRSE